MTTPVPKPPPGTPAAPLRITLEPCRVTLSEAEAAVVAEAIAVTITAREKSLRINGLVPAGRLQRSDPGIADLVALIDAHPALGARVRHRWPS